MTTRIVVTGGSGFVGRALLPILRARGDEVALLDRHDAQSLPSAVVDRVAHFRPDAVIHLATHFLSGHEPDDITALVRSNVEFGTVVAEAAMTSGARLVNVGSAWQHFEGAAYDPVSLYAATKQALDVIIEYYERVRGLDAVSVTLFDTYGPGDERPKLIPMLMRAADTGHAIEMSDGQQLIDLTYVDDVATGLVHVVSLPHPPRHGVLRSGRPVSIRDLVSVFEAATGRAVPVLWGARPSRPREMTSDWSYGSRPEGWHPTVDLAEGLARTWRSFEQGRHRP